MTIHLEGIPRDLIDRPNWVCWRCVLRDGDETKVPYNPKTGREAKSNDPKTWSTFERALQVVSRFKCNGVGWMFTKESGIVGLDFDECLDPVTGKLNPWVEKVVIKLNSYTEKSPSGTGIHIFVKGLLPPEGRVRGMKEFGFKQIEMYDSGRYFTVTGDRLETI